RLVVALGLRRLLDAAVRCELIPDVSFRGGRLRQQSDLLPGPVIRWGGRPIMVSGVLKFTSLSGNRVSCADAGHLPGLNLYASLIAAHYGSGC
ncbi:hypothetical protein, partial [Klebsiella pneumoniae]|uniref:hypothetical protein n=1 Tax=Klebsiella pneumoniae TaxID=573 RepID=UPI003B9801B8